MLSGVVGHEKVKRVLQSSYLDGRVGHAYIFEGPKGVGRLSAAKAFSKLLLCENPQNGEACGICKSCSMCESGNHPDVAIVTNQLYDQSKKSTDVLVDTIRNMKKDVYIKPYHSQRKIYIIPKADTMNMYAQNSLLKVLEEPPAYCTIILIAENSNMFLPTVLSRTVSVSFFPLSDADVEEYLKKNYPALSENATAIAAMSAGSIGKSKMLCESPELVKMRDSLIESFENLLGEKKRSIYDFVLFLKQNKDDFEILRDILQGIFCDLLHIKNTGDFEYISNPDKVSKLKNFNEQMNKSVPEKLLEILLKYNEYFLKNISYAQIAQCLGVELWEAIHDRSYRCEI